MEKIVSLKQALHFASDRVERAVKMNVSKAAHATTNRLCSVFAKTGKSVLNVFKQAQSAAARRWGESTGQKHGRDAEACGHEQGADGMLAHALLCLGDGFSAGVQDGLDGGLGLSGDVWKCGGIHGWIC
jgi:hypothetical protein